MKTQKEIDEFRERLKGLSDDCLLSEYYQCAGITYYQKLQMIDGWRERQLEAEFYYQEILARLTARNGNWYQRAVINQK